jgi:excisionase family DNA binding protein
VVVTDQYVTGLADEIADKVAARLGASTQLLTIRQVAERLAVSERTVYALTAGDPPELRSVLVGGSRRVEVAALDAYVRSRQDRD